MAKKEKDGVVTVEKLSEESTLNRREYETITNRLFNGMTPGNSVNKMNNEGRIIAKDKFTLTDNSSKKIEDDFANSSKSINISEKTFGSKVTDSSTQDDISSFNNSITVKPIGKSSDAIEDLFKNSTRSTLKMQSAMMEQNIKIAKTTFSSLNKMHRSIHDMSTFQRTVQTSYYKTSLTYKKDILEELKKITAILKTGFSIKEESKGKYSLNQKKGMTDSNKIMDQIFSGRAGGVFGGLKNAARATLVKQASGGAYSDFYDMAQMFLPLLEGMNGKSILRMAAGGIAGSQLTKLLGVRQSENLKNWMGNPREMLSNFSKSMMTSNNSLIKDFFSNFIDGEATSGKTKTFDIKEYMKRDPQGRAVFNNMTQRSITHIIPYHLANIEGFMGHLSRALGDKKDKPQFSYYDYKDNKFEKMDDIGKRMGNGAGKEFQKAIEKASKQYSGKSAFNPIKDLLDEQGKYQSAFLKEIANDKKKLEVIGADIISYCTICAQQGIDLGNLLNMRTPTPDELISMGVYPSDTDKKNRLARAKVLVRFITEIKRLRTDESKYLLDDIFGSVAEDLRNAYKKDTDEISNLANNSVSAWAYVVNEKNNDFNSRFSNNGKKFGFNANKSGSFDMKRWHEYFNERNAKKFKDVKFEDTIDKETIEREAAFMSGKDYGMAVKAYYELKHQVDAMKANGEEDSGVYKALKTTLDVLEKKKERLAEFIGVDNIKRDQDKFVANGYSRSKTKLEFTGDITSDFSTFKKWATEYMSTTGGKREANLALSGAAGAAIWKLTSSMGAGKIMAPVLGVVGGSALLMSGKLKGMIDVLGENGDIMMDNGKSRRENLMAKIMQDALPAGLGAATGIKVSNFIKNHLRFGTILGPILGTVTGTAIYAIGKSGLFKGLLKGLTFLPRLLFKKIFGKDAYDAAGKWIDEKTGGYFSGTTPSYKEILEATTDSKSLKAAQGAAIKYLDDLKVNEIEYANKIIKPLLAKTDKIKKANGDNKAKLTERELDALWLSPKKLEEVYGNYKKAVKATKTINEVQDILKRVMNERDIINKVNNTAFGQSESFKTVYNSRGNVEFHGSSDNSEAANDLNNRRSKFNERFSGDESAANTGEQEEGTGGAAYGNTKNRERDPGGYNPFASFNPDFSNVNEIKNFMNESGCAAFVASRLMEELTGSKGNANALYDTTLEYQRGKGIHYTYFTDFAKRLKLRYRITEMERPDLEAVSKLLIGDGKKGYHIFLTSNHPGHGHFILVWDIRNDKYMSSKVYDPLRPNMDRDNLSSLLYKTKKVITIFKGENLDTKDVTPKKNTSSKKESSSVDAVLDESYNNSAKMTGSSLTRKYAKGAVSGVNPIPVVIIGGHVDAVGNIGSIDMEGYKERVRMLAQESSTGSSPVLKKYANNVFTNYSKNKYNDEQKMKQDQMEEYAKENNELMKKGVGAGEGQKDNKKEKKGKGGLFGMLGAGAAGLLSLLGLGKGGAGGGIVNLLGQGVKLAGGALLSPITLAKNLLFRGGKKGIEEGAETVGKSFFNRNGQGLANGIKNVGRKIGGKIYESAFGSVTREVVKRDVKLMGQKVGEKTFTRTITKNGFLTGAVKKIAEFIPKIVGKLEKAPIIGSFIKKHDLAKKLVELLPKAIEKGAKEVAEEGAEAAGKAAAKNTASAAAGKSGAVTFGIGTAISLAFVGWDAYQAFKDAPKHFNTATPTLLQKVCSGIVGLTLSALNAFVASDPITITCITLLQMSNTIMGMMARFLYGVLNSFIKEKPNSGAKNVTEGPNAKYAKDENGNIIDNPENPGLFGGLFRKNTSEILGGLLTGAAQKLLPAGLSLGEYVIGLLGGIFNALVAGTSYALNGNIDPEQLMKGDGKFITGSGYTFGNSMNSTNTSSTSTSTDSTSTSTDSTSADANKTEEKKDDKKGKGSGIFGLFGRGDDEEGAFGSSLGTEGAMPSGVGYGTTKSSINGLTFVSQGQFMANKSMNGESLTQNGCAISAMKMVALHLGMKIPDNKLITEARNYLDKRTNSVDIEYYTAFGGVIVDDVMSVKHSISNPGSAVVLLVYKGEGQHFVTVINKGGNIYLGDPEEYDYIPTNLDDMYLNNFISAVLFENGGPLNILNKDSKGGRGRRSRLGGRASFAKKALGFIDNQSKLVKGAFNKVADKLKGKKKDSKPDSLYTVQQNAGGPGGGDVAQSTGGNAPGSAGWEFSRRQQRINEGAYYDGSKGGGKTLFGIDAKTNAYARSLGINEGNVTNMSWDTAEKIWKHWYDVSNLGKINSKEAQFALYDISGHAPGNLPKETKAVLAKYGQNVTGSTYKYTNEKLFSYNDNLIDAVNKLDASKAKAFALEMNAYHWNKYGYARNRKKGNDNYINTGVPGYGDGGKTFTWHGVTYGADGPVNGSGKSSTNNNQQQSNDKKGKGSGKFGRGTRFNRNFTGRGAADLFKLGGKPGANVKVPAPKQKGAVLQTYGKKPTTSAEQAVANAGKNNTGKISVTQTGVANTGTQASSVLARPKWLEKAIGENGSTNYAKYGGPAKAWCQAFVNWAFRETGYSVPNDLSSQAPVSSDQWVKLKGAVPGCVIVLAKGSGKGKAADQDGPSGHGHSMFFVGKGEGPGATWKVCTGNPQVRVKDYHIAQSGKTFVGYFIPKSALKDLKGAEQIAKTDKSDINNQSNEGGGAENTANNGGGTGPSATVIAKGKFITSSGKVFNITKLITGAMQALGKIGTASSGGGTQANGDTGGGNTSGAAGPLGLSASNDLVPNLKVGTSGAGKDTPAYKAAEIAVNSEYGRKTTSAHECAKGVMTHISRAFNKSYSSIAGNANQFLGAGGLTGRSDDGSRKSVLQSLGYQMISVTSTPYPGDILVYNKPTQKNWFGHITLLAANGKWISDFTQPGFFVYRASKPTAAKYTMWRYGTGNGGDIDDDMVGDVKLKPILKGSGFKTTANVKMVPREPNFGNNQFMGMGKSQSSSVLGMGNSNQPSINKGVWNPVSRVSKVKWSGEADLSMAEFKQTLDKLNTTMLTGISVNKDILKASVDQMGILGDISKTAKKQYKLSQQKIKGITLDGKGEDNFKKLQEKLNEWTNALKKDYNVAVQDFS